MNSSEDLIMRVQALVDEVDKTHRYSMSRIYGLYNEVHNTAEAPQSCASCLIRKVKELKKWLAGQQPGERVERPKRKRTKKG